MPSKSSAAVDDLINGLDHPLIAEVRALRDLILGVDPAIREEIKWNSPSFYTSEHFATMRLNGKPPLQLILHLGAKKQSLPTGSIDDPEGILKWLGPDRAVVNVPTSKAFTKVEESIAAVIRQWLKYVPAAKAD